MRPSYFVACVAGGIVRVRRKILTVESEYGRWSREENGKEPLYERGTFSIKIGI